MMSRMPRAVPAPPTSAAREAAEPASLFDGYLDPARPHTEAYDEMFDPELAVRPGWKALHDSLAPAQESDLASRAEALGRAFADQGITFSLSGQESPFPLDLVPRVIGAGEWTRLERGIVQRVRALEAFLADVHGDGEIIRDGLLPRRLLASCEHFHRGRARLLAAQRGAHPRRRHRPGARRGR